MRILANQTGVQAPDADYPKGRIVNNQTIISEEINGDIVNLFQKLVSLASISENGNPDNETNGYQLLQAFAAYVRSLAATESASGVVERANQTEVNTGSDDARYITPLKLRSTTFISAQIPNLDASKITSGTFAAARIPNLDASKITTGTFAAARIPQATTTSVGGSELATQNEVNAGTDAQKIVCPSTFAGCYAMTTRAGTVTLATQAEVNAGTDQLKVITPETLAGLFKNSWATATLNTGWAALLSQNLRYRLFGNLLHIIGYIEKDTTSTNLIATLPAGFRPSADVWFPVSSTFIINYYDAISSPPSNVDACLLESDGQLRYAASTNIAYKLSINALIPLSF